MKLSIIFIVCSNKIENRVMLSGEGMQRRKTVKKNNRSLISKSNFLVQRTFSEHFFAVVLHDYNAKLPETS